MQFAYQYPERTERLVLVAPGGIGPEVTPLIRAVTLPGAHQVLGALTLPGVRHLAAAGMRTLARSGNRHLRDLGEVATIYEDLADPRTRSALRRVVRAVVDLRGQMITMTDRAYLTEAMPLLFVWGEDDAVIPARHAERVALVAPTAVVEVLPNSGHFPHKDHPERFAKILHDFVRHTRPSTYDRDRWRALLRDGPTEPISDQLAEVAALDAG